MNRATTMDDQELVALLQEDADAAIACAMRQYMGLVYSIVSHLLKNACTREDIEECVSDVFFQFYKQRDRIDIERGTVKAYLCVIAKRRAINMYRSKLRKPQSMELLETLPDQNEELLPEQHAMQREQILSLIEAIYSLGELDAEIILRKYYLKESSKSIAARLDMKVSTLDSRASRAVKKLQAYKGSVME